MKNSVVKNVLLFLKGIVVGAANIIPGVSGGTIAVIMGIFDRLIEALNTLFKKFKENLLFLLPVGLGAAVGIVGLSRVINWALSNYEVQTNFFFVGLVAGSIPLIYKRAVSKSSFKPIYIIPFLIGAACVIGMAFITPSGGGEAAIQTLTFGNFFKMLGGGAIAAAAMVVPGISGSLVMVLLGMYSSVTLAIEKATTFGNFDTMLEGGLVLVPLAIGVLIGIFTIAKIIEIVMKKYFTGTYFGIFGLMIGSLGALLINMDIIHQQFNASVILGSLITTAAGFFTAFYLGREKDVPEESELLPDEHIDDKKDEEHL